MEQESVFVNLYADPNVENSFAIRLQDETSGWKAERGFGAAFEKIWSVEIQLRAGDNLQRANWDSILERVVEAYEMRDPVISGFIVPNK